MNATQRKIRRLLYRLSGGFGVAAILSVGYFRAGAFDFGWAQAVILGAWAIVLAAGYFSQTARVAHFSDSACMIFISVTIVVSLFEFVFRAAGFDFSREERATMAYPPFYRLAAVPLGEVYYRRSGPEEWKGQPIRKLMQLHGLEYDPYKNEPVIEVKYNHLGFRQEEGYRDWDLAIAGDSFTELGILGYDQLPTTRVGKLLNLRVVNLGVSVTGPLTHLSYLRAFGIAPSTRRIMIIFFEGNDVSDLDAEFSALSRFRETGQREYRRFNRQSSLLKAIMNAGSGPARKQPADRVTAMFQSATADIPISLDYLPHGSADLTKSTMRQLEYFFAQYAELAGKNGVEAWLAYMPCKITVVHSQIKFLDSAPQSQVRWTPTDLPETVATLSGRHGIHFLDLTPSLLRATKKDRALLFNPFYDTHLNAAGAEVVAQEIAHNCVFR